MFVCAFACTLICILLYLYVCSLPLCPCKSWKERQKLQNVVECYPPKAGSQNSTSSSAESAHLLPQNAPLSPSHAHANQSLPPVFLCWVVYLSVCLSVSLSVWLSVCLSVLSFCLVLVIEGQDVGAQARARE